MNTIAINNKNRTIEMPSKKYATAASKFGTDEYKALQEARRDYPTYRVVTSARKPRKIEFAGLTYSYMEKYIASHDDEEQSMKTVPQGWVLRFTALPPDYKRWLEQKI